MNCENLIQDVFPVFLVLLGHDLNFLHTFFTSHFPFEWTFEEVTLYSMML